MNPKDTFEIQDFPIHTESDKMPVWRKFENPPESLEAMIYVLSFRETGCQLPIVVECTKHIIIVTENE